jgi:hypothetical protein
VITQEIEPESLNERRVGPTLKFKVALTISKSVLCICFSKVHPNTYYFLKHQLIFEIGRCVFFEVQNVFLNII